PCASVSSLPFTTTPASVIYTLSLHDALPICDVGTAGGQRRREELERVRIVVDDEDAQSHEDPLQRRGSGRGGVAAFSGSSIAARPAAAARSHRVPITAPQRDGFGSQEKCQISHGGVTGHCRDYMPASSAVKR